jgi:hypothetical protein
MAGTFSGGMKRRLSVAISMIGQPLCCYLVRRQDTGQHLYDVRVMHS